MEKQLQSVILDVINRNETLSKKGKKSRRCSYQVIREQRSEQQHK